MSVPVDDSDSYNDLQLDFDAHKNHAFSLDNVSYITKSTGQHSPTSSEAATTARASSEIGPNMVFASNNENVMFRDNKNYQSSFNYLAETTTELWKTDAQIRINFIVQPDDCCNLYRYYIYKWIRIYH